MIRSARIADTRLAPAAALGAVLLLPACADLAALTRTDVAVTASPAGTSAASPPAGPVPEATTRAWVPGRGYVRGTAAALARLGEPLPSAPGENGTVEACRAAVEGEARKLGAGEVEAASGGPHRRDRAGRLVAPVLVRITYPRPGGYEVRESTLTCVVDRRGALVEARG